MVNSITPYVSAIIPVKNEEKSLPGLLYSFRSQVGFNASNLEIIVADAKSTDDTVKIAEEYGCIIVDGGLPAVGRNRGAEIAKGEILLYKDADSKLPNDYFLSSATREMEERNLDVATPLYYALHEKKGFASWRYDMYIKIASSTTEKAENTSNPLMMNCMFARRNVHKALKGFDERLEFGEDAEFAKRAKQAVYNFGILRNCGLVGFNMRKAEKSFLDELRWLAINVYFTTGRRFGHEFIRGKSIIKYLF